MESEIERAKITNLKFIRGEGGKQIIEAYATLSLQKSQGEKYSLDCFLGSGSEAEQAHAMGMKEGDLVSVLLKLVSFSFKIYTSAKDKYLKQSKPTPAAVNTSNLRGKIIELKEENPNEKPNLYTVIIDCGVYVHSCVGFTKPPRIGDYIELEGRLDAHIWGKAN